MQSVRPAAVAGMFYPGNPVDLAHDVDALLAQAVAVAPNLQPKALIAPHAGYIYSGAVAASAYGLLKPIAQRIRRVVLLGPTHRVAVRGLALPGVTCFSTPLGCVAIDADAVRQIAHLPQVSISPQAHALEHSLEVHLPFLQTLLPEFKLLPLAVGMASPEDVEEVLETLWGGVETLIIISSDLSHYLPYDLARKVDGETAQAILELRQPVSHQQACGGTPVNGLILAARRHNLTPHLLDLRNSGDTAGDRDRVVGYGAFAFTEHGQSVRDAERGATLIKLARASIAAQFGVPLPDAVDEAWLIEPGACFVTLTQNGNLRGCIGSLAAHRPLLQDVHANAVAAAFRDSRFAPLQETEFADTAVEVSLLSLMQPLAFDSEQGALAQLRPGVDGVVFEYEHYRSTFLPQVWEQLPTPEAFITKLKHKAGLPGDFWADEVRLSRYTVEKWKEFH